MKKSKQNIIPTIKNFTDEDGKKWVQTSTNDFLSLKELSDMLESVEQDKDPGDIIFAKLEFYKVNQEYHDLAVSLQEKLIQQTELLKKVINESKKIIDKKNDKLNELIIYIRKLHNYFEYIKSNEKEPDFMVPSEIKAHDWKSDHLISDLKDFSQEEHDNMMQKKKMEADGSRSENNFEEKSNMEETANMEENNKTNKEDLKLSDIDTSDGEEFEMMMLEDVEIFMSDLNDKTKLPKNSSDLEGDKTSKEEKEEEPVQDETEEIVIDLSEDVVVLESNKK